MFSSDRTIAERTPIRRSVALALLLLALGAAAFLGPAAHAGTYAAGADRGFAADVLRQKAAEGSSAGLAAGAIAAPTATNSPEYPAPLPR